MKKVIILGNNTIGVELTKHCLEHPQIEILAVRPEPNDKGVDNWQKSLLKFCLDNRIKILNERKLSNERFVKKIKNFNPDFIFSFQCRSIIPKSIINIPKYGIINLHFAYLPKYRGCYPIAWALLNGEKEVGVTLHYIDDGIDTGDIIYQEKIPVLSKDTARSIFDKLTNLGILIFKRKIDDLLRLNIQPKKQLDREAIYYSKYSLDFSKNFINWNQNNILVYNFIKAFIFPPYQYPQTRYKNKTFSVSKCRLSKRNFVKIQPGTIISLSNNKIVVATKKGYIDILEVIYKNKKISSLELAKVLKLKNGDIFYF